MYIERYKLDFDILIPIDIVFFFFNNFLLTFHNVKGKKGEKSKKKTKLSGRSDG